ncbi:MAG: hypothetical protein PUP91_05865 [Rhizonema sp. PD37]|nr:hypothetical protein [Rhizonema sp. PD37]
MNLNYINKKFFPPLKMLSIFLITGAIGLEIWNIYAVINEIIVPRSLQPIFWIERFAVITHLIEGLIASFFAHSKKKIPIIYGVYTFFVGTIGLLELFDDSGVSEERYLVSSEDVASELQEQSPDDN